MAEQIALIEAPVRDVTFERGPRVMHELCQFPAMGGQCRVRHSHSGDILELKIGSRVFAVSLTELAATATIAIEGHLKGEIRAKVIASRETPKPEPAPVVDIPVCGVVEADGFITLYSGPDQ